MHGPGGFLRAREAQHAQISRIRMAESNNAKRKQEAFRHIVNKSQSNYFTSENVDTQA